MEHVEFWTYAHSWGLSPGYYTDIVSTIDDVHESLDPVWISNVPFWSLSQYPGSCVIL
jgi:hypothetical protein